MIDKKRICILNRRNDIFCYTIMISTLIEFVWNLQKHPKNRQRNLLNSPKYPKKIDEKRVRTLLHIWHLRIILE